MKARFSVVVIGIVVGVAGIAYAAQHKIGQKGRLFNPSALTVKVGDTLTFENDDDVTHHVYSPTKGQEFDLKPLSPGEKKTQTFAKTGRVDIRCGLHPGMRLVVTVE